MYTRVCVEGGFVWGGNVNFTRCCCCCYMLFSISPHTYGVPDERDGGQTAAGLYFLPGSVEEALGSDVLVFISGIVGRTGVLKDDGWTGRIYIVSMRRDP